MDNHKDKQDNSVDENQTADLSRRQIIRGMAASVPVVLTLSNAHAQAVASTLSCIDKSAQAVQAQVGSADANDRHCVPDTNPPVSPIVPARSDVTGNPIQDTGNGTPIRAVPGDNVGGIDYSTQSCVYYVDLNGSPVGFSDNAGGVPTAASCYTSFT